MKQRELVPISLGDTVYVYMMVSGKEFKGEVVHIFPGYVNPKREDIKKYYGPNCPEEMYGWQEVKRIVIEFKSPDGYVVIPYTNDYNVVGKENGVIYSVYGGNYNDNKPKH